MIMISLRQLRDELKPVFTSLMHVAEFKECSRCCNDKGYISAYKHVKGGVCFKCKGRGTQPANKAARDALAINRCFSSIHRSYKLGIRDLTSHPEMKELKVLIPKIAKKYKQYSKIEDLLF